MAYQIMPAFLILSEPQHKSVPVPFPAGSGSLSESVSILFDAASPRKRSIPIPMPIPTPIYLQGYLCRGSLAAAPRIFGNRHLALDSMLVSLDSYATSSCHQGS